MRNIVPNGFCEKIIHKNQKNDFIQRHSSNKQTMEETSNPKCNHLREKKKITNNNKSPEKISYQIKSQLNPSQMVLCSLLIEKIIFNFEELVQDGDREKTIEFLNQMNKQVDEIKKSVRKCKPKINQRNEEEISQDDF